MVHVTMFQAVYSLSLPQTHACIDMMFCKLCLFSTVYVRCHLEAVRKGLITTEDYDCLTHTLTMECRHLILECLMVIELPQNVSGSFIVT